MRRKIIKYLATKQGVQGGDVRTLSDGRFDLMGDLEGVLAALRKCKDPAEQAPAKTTKKPKEPKAKAVKKKPKSPKQKKPKAVKTKAVKVKVTKPFTGALQPSSPPQVSPRYDSLKMAFARKDRVTMTWTPRESEVKGASLLLSLASSEETVSPFKINSDPVSKPVSTKNPLFGEETVETHQSKRQTSCQSMHVPVMESILEGVSC